MSICVDLTFLLHRIVELLLARFSPFVQALFRTIANDQTEPKRK